MYAALLIGFVFVAIAGGVFVWFYKDHINAKVKAAEDKLHAVKAAVSAPTDPKAK